MKRMPFNLVVAFISPSRTYGIVWFDAFFVFCAPLFPGFVEVPVVALLVRLLGHFLACECVET